MVDVDTAGSAGFPAVAAEWLRDAVPAVAPRLWDSVMRSLPLCAPEFWDDPHGKPGSVWGSVYVWDPERGIGGTPRPLSMESLDWLTSQLDRFPRSACLELCILGADGLPEESGENVVRVTMETDDEWSWVGQLQIISSLPEEREGEPGDTSRRWADFAYRIANRVDPTFAHICDDSVPLRETGLDRSVYRGGVRASIREGRERLRGYSWVTVVPAELARRLGGAAALKRSGVFHQVEELPGGAVWLRAGQDMGDYDDSAMEGVFEALAPVLPRGPATPDPTVRRLPRLVWKDAGSVRP